MRLDAPRIPPLDDAEMTDEQRQALEPFSRNGRRAVNIFRTLARAPKALARFNEWGSYVLSRRNSLSPREREILQLVAEGKSNKEIANLLNLSVYTVETHRAKIMQKLNLKGVPELILYAVRKGIIS